MEQGRNGTEWGAMGQGCNGMGLQWNTGAMGLTGVQWDRGTIGQGCNGMGSQRNRGAMGWGHTGMALECASQRIR